MIGHYVYTTEDYQGVGGGPDWAMFLPGIAIGAWFDADVQRGGQRIGLVPPGRALGYFVGRHLFEAEGRGAVVSDAPYRQSGHELEYFQSARLIRRVANWREGVMRGFILESARGALERALAIREKLPFKLDGCFSGLDAASGLLARYNRGLMSDEERSAWSAEAYQDWMVKHGEGMKARVYPRGSVRDLTFYTEVMGIMEAVFHPCFWIGVRRIGEGSVMLRSSVAHAEAMSVIFPHGGATEDSGLYEAVEARVARAHSQAWREARWRFSSYLTEGRSPLTFHE